MNKPSAGNKQLHTATRSLLLRLGRSKERRASLVAAREWQSVRCAMAPLTIVTGHRHRDLEIWPVLQFITPNFSGVSSAVDRPTSRQSNKSNAKQQATRRRGTFKPCLVVIQIHNRAFRSPPSSAHLRIRWSKVESFRTIPSLISP